MRSPWIRQWLDASEFAAMLKSTYDNRRRICVPSPGKFVKGVDQAVDSFQVQLAVEIEAVFQVVADRFVHLFNQFFAQLDADTHSKSNIDDRRTRYALTPGFQGAFSQLRASFCQDAVKTRGWGLWAQWRALLSVPDRRGLSLCFTFLLWPLDRIDQLIPVHRSTVLHESRPGSSRDPGMTL